MIWNFKAISGDGSEKTYPFNIFIKVSRLRCGVGTPHLNPVTPGQQKYNNAHIKTRNVVKRQYGILCNYQQPLM